MLRDLANGHTDLLAPNVFEHVRCLTCLASHDAAMDILMKEHPGRAGGYGLGRTKQLGIWL